MEHRGGARVPAGGQLCEPLAAHLAAAAGHQEVRVGRQDCQRLVRPTQENQGQYKFTSKQKQSFKHFIF